MAHNAETSPALRAALAPTTTRGRGVTLALTVTLAAATSLALAAPAGAVAIPAGAVAIPAGAVTAPAGAVTAPAGAVTEPPGAPGTPVVSALTTTSATVTWTAAPGADSDRYDIWRVTADSDQFYTSTIGTTYTFAWLTPDTRYTFFVEPEGDSWLPSGRVTFRTLPAPDEKTPPSRPGTPVVTELTDTTAVLQWQPSTDNVAVTSYRIYQIVDERTELFSGSLQSSTKLWTLMPDMDYTLLVTALDASGNESEPSAAVSLRTHPDANTTCRASYTSTPKATGSTEYRASVTFVNTGHFLNGWTLRVTLPAQARVISQQPRGYLTGSDVVFWHSMYGNYGLPLGGRERLDFEVSYPGPDPGPTAVALNGHLCKS